MRWFGRRAARRTSGDAEPVTSGTEQGEQVEPAAVPDLDVLLTTRVPRPAEAPATTAARGAVTGPFAVTRWLAATEAVVSLDPGVLRPVRRDLRTYLQDGEPLSVLGDLRARPVLARALLGPHADPADVARAARDEDWRPGWQVPVDLYDLLGEVPAAMALRWARVVDMCLGSVGDPLAAADGGWVASLRTAVAGSDPDRLAALPAVLAPLLREAGLPGAAPAPTPTPTPTPSPVVEPVADEAVEPVPAEPVADEAEAPVAGEPVVEQPAVAEPVAEEPPAEEPEVADEPATPPPGGRATFDADGVLTLSYGPRSFTATITRSLGLELRDQDGAAVRSLPPQRKTDDPEAVAHAKALLAQARAELRATLAQFTDELRGAIESGTWWTGAEWTAHVLGHPVRRHLATRVLWTVGDRVVRPDEDGVARDVTGAAVEVPVPARVAATVPTRLDADERAAWTAALADVGVTLLRVRPPA